VRLPRLEMLFMHDFLIGFVFVAMIAFPAIAASSPKLARNEDH
jgi:hypothetical protein